MAIHIHPDQQTPANLHLPTYLPPDTDPAAVAVRDWMAHVAAGRIGAPAAPPPASASDGPDYRIASLERLLRVDLRAAGR